MSADYPAGVAVDQMMDELMKLIRPKFIDDPECKDEVRAVAERLCVDFDCAVREVGDGNETVWIEYTTGKDDDGKPCSREVAHRRKFCVAVSLKTERDGNPNNQLSLEYVLNNVMVLCFDVRMRLDLVALLLPYVNRRMTLVEVERSDQGKILITVQSE